MKNALLPALLSLMVLCLITFSCQKEEVAPDVLQVLSLTEKVGNYGYEELSQESIKWMFSKPLAQNPLSDETGALFDVKNQPIPNVMILQSNLGGKSTRAITVPAGHYVFITPLATFAYYFENDKCDPTKPAQGQSLDNFVYSYIDGWMDAATNLSAKLDGVEMVPDLKKYRVKTKMFQMLLDKDYTDPNCDYSNQKAYIVGDGYQLLFKLPKGKHVLTFQGDIPDPTNPFHAEVTWNLTVE
ncbi:hypothetical protein [Runella aurantiaca]|uniref:DUF4198 domain-containing protein n=1 Tax=Runella aurantiaca TaxID=2282308 RepID=A0A369HYB9_9BACT|nr:hypothetical protein [Runella aurantiaca]RDB02338.1 hypothetical protein DVG78_29375 [Runella aurantiaca]